MGLSCGCDEWDGEGVGWFVPVGFSILKTKKAKRCKSCNVLIKPASSCLEFKRFRYPNTEIELKIYGDDVELAMAPQYLCASCGEIFINLDDLGFCVKLGENMNSLLEEYRHEYQKNNGLYTGGS
jgi:hypothetical protein